MARRFSSPFRPVLVATFGALVLAASSSVQAGEWYFKVKNATGLRIVGIETKEQGGRWGGFRLNGAIAPGKTVTLEWAESANNQDCVQWIRAQFSDGSYSGSGKFDFCKDLDVPIEIR